MRFLMLALVASTGLVLAACGGSTHNSGAPPVTTAGTATAPPRPTTTGATSAAGAAPLQAEATAAAAGDIPDNQVFLTFHDSPAGYSISYPEGWAQQGTGPSVGFHDKNNIVRIVVTRGSLPTVGAARADLATKTGARIESAPGSLTLSGSPAIKVVYSTQSAPNPVTGKRVTLVVDRYYLAHAGRKAIIDLGTPRGVDNVDAYRQMIESFRWR
jgi:hypothetical protein